MYIFILWNSRRYIKYLTKDFRGLTVRTRIVEDVKGRKEIKTEEIAIYPAGIY